MNRTISIVAQRVAALEVWGVAGAVAISIVFPQYLIVSLAVAAVFWPVRWLAKRHLTIRTPADWALLLLLVMIPVTLWATALPETTQPQVLRLLTGIALYYAVVNWATTHTRLRLIQFGLLGTGLALALAAPVVVQWPSGKLPIIPTAPAAQFPTLVSDTINANVMAGTLILFIPLTLAPILFEPIRGNVLQQVGLALTAVLMVAMLILTQSRGAVLAFGLSMIALMLLRWPRSWIVVPLLLGGAGLGVRRLGVNTVLDQLGTTGTVGGLDSRLEIWSRAIYMIQDFPFTGIGMGSFTEVTDLLYPLFLVAPGTVSHAHNLFLQVAVDLGVPGLIAWLATLMVVMAGAWSVARGQGSGRTQWMAGVGAGLFGSQVALVTHGLVDAVTWGIVRTAPLVWALWATTSVAWNLQITHDIDDTEVSADRTQHAALTEESLPI